MGDFILFLRWMLKQVDKITFKKSIVAPQQVSNILLFNINSFIHSITVECMLYTRQCSRHWRQRSIFTTSIIRHVCGEFCLNTQLYVHGEARAKLPRVWSVWLLDLLLCAAFFVCFRNIFTILLKDEQEKDRAIGESKTGNTQNS